MSPPSGGESSGSSGISTLIMFGMIGVIFFFMIYRPQKKRQKEREALINQMEKGDKVITSSGIHGTIAQIDDTTVLVQVSDNTKLKFEKSAVNTVVNKKSDKPEKVEKVDKPEKADKLEKAA
jgi:preprotein translocase subunit YajC